MYSPSLAQPSPLYFESELHAESSSPKAVRRIKVLIFYQDFGQFGGIERYLTQLAAGFAIPGSEIQPVFVCSGNTRLYSALQEIGYTIYGLHSPAIFAKSFLRSFDWGTFLQLRRIIQLEKPDILHTHIGLWELLLFKTFGVPVCHTFHGYGSLYRLEKQKSGIKGRFRALWKRWVASSFKTIAHQLDSFYVVSEAETKRLQAEGFLSIDKPVTVIPNGVSNALIQQEQQGLLQIKNAIKAKLGIASHQRVISMVSRLDDNKNPQHFVEVAQRLSQLPQYEDCVFLMGGEGPLLSWVQASALTCEAIRAVGFYPSVQEIWAITDLAVFPAWEEGFGLSLVEAMAAGTLCVAYANAGGITILDTPQTQGCLVPVGQLALLMERVQALLDAPEIQQQEICQALQHRALDFDWQKTQAQIVRAYQQLCPLISIIMPVYNGANFVTQAIQSVMAQRYPHWELLVVNDGSMDTTQAVLEAWLAEHPDERVQVFHRQNQGVAATRNFAFSQAKGELIAFLDADDRWLPGYLEKSVQIIRQQSNPDVPAMLIYSGYFAVSEKNQLLNLPPVPQEEGFLLDAVLSKEGLFLPSTTVMHRQVFEAIGGFQSSCYHEDRVFFIRACQVAPAYATGKRLVLYQQSESGRCRAILKDYTQALQAELSIVEGLQHTDLTAKQLDALQFRQMGNLMCRFLMYGQLKHAKTLWVQLKKDYGSEAALLFDGKKGKLAQWSLQSGINCLFGLRCIVQFIMKQLPAWIYTGLR